MQKRLGLCFTLLMGSGLLWADPLFDTPRFRNLVQLRPLQTYEIGLMSSVQDAYGQYDAKGNWTELAQEQAWVMGLGVALRLTERSEVFGLLPVVRHTSRPRQGGYAEGPFLGDIYLGGRTALVDNYFESQWFPKVLLGVGARLPTARVRIVAPDGRVLSGTGLSVWEPYVELSALKEYAWVTVAMTLTAATRFAANRQIDGARAEVDYGGVTELGASASVPLNQLWNAGGGLWSRWEGVRAVNGVNQTDSESQLTGFSFFLSHYPTRFWTVSLGFDMSVPSNSFGRNSKGIESISMSASYSAF